MDVFVHLAKGFSDIEDEGELVVGPAQIAMMFVDWTDPQKVM